MNIGPIGSQFGGAGDLLITVVFGLSAIFALIVGYIGLTRSAYRLFVEAVYYPGPSNRRGEDAGEAVRSVFALIYAVIVYFFLLG